MSEKSMFGEDLMQAMTEALAHAKSKNGVQLRVTAVDLETVDAKSIREKLRLTQDEMTAFLGTSASGHKKWEQGARQPSGAAPNRLACHGKEPEAVLRALAN